MNVGVSVVGVRRVALLREDKLYSAVRPFVLGGTRLTIDDALRLPDSAPVHSLLIPLRDGHGASSAGAGVFARLDPSVGTHTLHSRCGFRGRPMVFRFWPTICKGSDARLLGMVGCVG